MKITTMSWVLSMSLGATLVAGCGERQSARGGPEAAALAPAQAPAPVAMPTPAATMATTTAQAPIAPPSVQPKVASQEPSTKDAKSTPVKAVAIDKLHVKRLVIADSVANREPVDPRASFEGKKTDRIYAFVEIENDSKDKTQIVVEFEPPKGGAARGNVTLDVGPSRGWRTWAFTREAHQAGEWTAIVKTSDGEVLAKTPFTVS